MNYRQQHVLALRDIDLRGAIQRLGGNEDIYVSCLRAFQEDKTTIQLNRAITDKSWDEAFTSAHALKGLAGNMGFVPLMHSVGQLLVLIRGGRTRELHDCLELVNSSYRDTIDAIDQFFTLADEETKGVN